MRVTDERQARPGRRPFVVTLCLLAALGLVWILGTMPSAGPDEPTHIVRGAALLRGQLDGEKFAGQGRAFDLPAWVGHPDHACFALQENQPADCATAIPRPSGQGLLPTTAWQYPVWGHLAPGVGTLLPAPIANQAARVFDAALPIGLITATLALARRRGPAALGGAMLAVTPMAWFSIIVVNPSGLVIAGGLALWAGLLHVNWQCRIESDRVEAHGGVGFDRLTSWTIAAGWAACVLPRRDGLIWAALILALCVAVGAVDVRSLARRIGRAPLALVAMSTVATMAWAATATAASSKLLLVTPLVPLAGVVVHRVWTAEAANQPGRRLATLCGGIVLAGTASFALMALRSAGFDGELFGRLVSQTGINLEEAIGLLGSLDTPIPRSALFVWLAALGVLAGAAIVAGRSSAVAAAATLVVIGIVSAWVLEMNQGNASGTYWQGRYYLPLLVGVPMIIGWAIGDGAAPRSGAVSAASQRSLLIVVSSSAMFVMTLSFGASMRRWAVGTSGSINPRNWDTYATSLPPVLLLAAHGLIAVVVVAAVTRWSAVSAPLLELSEGAEDVDTVLTHEH